MFQRPLDTSSPEAYTASVDAHSLDSGMRIIRIIRRIRVQTKEIMFASSRTSHGASSPTVRFCRRTYRKNSRGIHSVESVTRRNRIPATSLETFKEEPTGRLKLVSMKIDTRPKATQPRNSIPAVAAPWRMRGTGNKNQAPRPCQPRGAARRGCEFRSVLTLYPEP